LDTHSWSRLLVLLVALLITVGSSATHAALTRVNRGRLRHLAAEGVPWSRSLLAMAEDSASVESTLLATFALGLAVAASTTGTLMSDLLGAGPGASAVGVASLVLMLWSLIAARAVGASHPDSTLYHLRLPLRLFHALLRPLIRLLRGASSHLSSNEQQTTNGVFHVADEELRMLVDAVEEEGPLEEEERDMIYGIVEMGERTAREIMVPRVDMVAVEADEPLRNVHRRIRETGHSRIPVYEETVDNIIGVAYAKDLLSYLVDGSLDTPARALVRQPRFTPESKKIDELLHDMQRARVHMVVVLDEYGGTAGLVTIEDLIEEIVGEIQDEYDVEEKTIEKLGDDEALFDARVSVHDVNDTLGLLLTEGEYDTLGGLVYDQLGKIPAVGDEVRVNGACIRVLSISRQRIKKVRVKVEAREAV